MEELRGQIIEMLEGVFWKWQDNANPNKYSNITDQILTLFQDWLKQQIEKLEVIGDEEIMQLDKVICSMTLKEPWQEPREKAVKRAAKKYLEAQLQSDKDKLLRMME